MTEPASMSLGCATCDAFLAKFADKAPYVGYLHGMGRAVVIRDGNPEGHYGFRLRREGNECPRCGRRVVLIEDNPRSMWSTTYVELTRGPGKPAR